MTLETRLTNEKYATFILGRGTTVTDSNWGNLGGGGGGHENDVNFYPGGGTTVIDLYSNITEGTGGNIWNMSTSSLGEELQ